MIILLKNSLKISQEKIDKMQVAMFIRYFSYLLILKSLHQAVLNLCGGSAYSEAPTGEDSKRAISLTLYLICQL